MIKNILKKLPLQLQRHILKEGIYMIHLNMGTEATSKGVTLSEVYGARSPWGAPEFPLVSPAYNHTVLYHVPSDGSYPGDRPPRPQIGQDKWDHEYVRMPCSDQSLYPVINEYGETRLQKRWDIIQKALTQPIHNSDELAAAILTYNTKFKNIWKFRALHQLFNQYLEEEESLYFFEVTLPQIAHLALELPKLIQCPIPLLKQHKNKSISLSQQQISSLLANAFFCTFPRRNTNKKASEYASYPYINFNILYECSGDSTLEKLKCICHYFKRICTKVPVGIVTFSRRSVPPAKCPQWIKSECSLASLALHVDSENTIEDAHGLIQVDFANKFLGGGVIGHGCVQEEIRFVICPELMISMLFTEVLRPNEALMIIGSERYSKYIGYGNSFQWAGDYVDQTPIDSSGRRRTVVLAIDALPYSSITHEYRREFITRELNKAWVGFTFFTEERSGSVEYPGVATGNWGCGAFGGSAHLKCLIQIMACACAARPIAYYTFHDTQLRDDILNVANLLSTNNVTVGQLYKYILKFTTTDVRRNNLHEFIYQAIRDDAKVKSTAVTMETVDKGVFTNINSDVVMSAEVEKEFLQNSPDIFSQDEEISINKSDENNSDMSGVENETESKMAEGSDMAESSNKMAERQTSNQTSRLFHEMEKLDKGNGKLNLSSFGLNTSNFNESCDERLQADVSEKKRKMARKITDYFSKKNFTSL